MAAGKRVKFQDTRIQFLTGWSADSPSDVVASITRANPTVLGIANHGRARGDVIRLLNAVGMTEVNDTPFLVGSVPTASTLSLLDVNSTDYGVYTSNSARADLAQFTTLCELTGFNRQGGSSPEIDATAQCDTEQQFETGLPDFGTVQVDFNYVPDVAVQQAIENFYVSGEKMAYRINYLKKPGVFIVGFGTVQQTSEQGQVGGLWTGSFTMRLTGRKYAFGVV